MFLGVSEVHLHLVIHVDIILRPAFGVIHVLVGINIIEQSLYLAVVSLHHDLLQNICGKFQLEIPCRERAFFNIELLLIIPQYLTNQDRCRRISGLKAVIAFQISCSSYTGAFKKHSGKRHGFPSGYIRNATTDFGSLGKHRRTDQYEN